MKARPRRTCEATPLNRAMGRFWDRPTHNRKGRRATGPWLQEHYSCRVSDSSLFVIDKSCPLLRRGRGDEFLETRIIPERIEHWIEPEQRESERHVLSQRAPVWCRE
jgi:hypothetical protein